MLDEFTAVTGCRAPSQEHQRQPIFCHRLHDADSEVGTPEQSFASHRFGEFSMCSSHLRSSTQNDV